MTKENAKTAISPDPFTLERCLDRSRYVVYTQAIVQTKTEMQCLTTMEPRNFDDEIWDWLRGRVYLIVYVGIYERKCDS